MFICYIFIYIDIGAGQGGCLDARAGQPSTKNPTFSTLNPEPYTLDPEPQTINRTLSTLNHPEP